MAIRPSARMASALGVSTFGVPDALEALKYGQSSLGSSITPLPLRSSKSQMALTVRSATRKRDWASAGEARPATRVRARADFMSGSPVVAIFDDARQKSTAPHPVRLRS